MKLQEIVLQPKIPIFQLTKEREQLSPYEKGRLIFYAFESTGGFFIHDPELCRVYDSLISAAKTFFYLPPDIKEKYAICKGHGHSGWVGPKEAPQKKSTDETAARAYETFDYHYPGDMTSVFHMGIPEWTQWYYGQNILPEVARFDAYATLYFQKIRNIAEQIAELFALGAGLDVQKFLHLLREPSCSQTRCIHHFPVKTSQQGMSLGIHTDYECFTIIRGDTGLQALLGGQWFPLTYPTDCFFCFPGDMLEILTSGVIQSLQHRVPYTGQERNTVVYFQGMRYDEVVCPIETRNEAQWRITSTPKTRALDYYRKKLRGDFRYLQQRE